MKHEKYVTINRNVTRYENQITSYFAMGKTQCIAYSIIIHYHEDSDIENFVILLIEPLKLRERSEAPLFLSSFRGISAL